MLQHPRFGREQQLCTLFFFSFNIELRRVFRQLHLHQMQRRVLLAVQRLPQVFRLNQVLPEMPVSHRVHRLRHPIDRKHRQSLLHLRKRKDCHWHLLVCAWLYQQPYGWKLNQMFCLQHHIPLGLQSASQLHVQKRIQTSQLDSMPTGLRRWGLDRRAM